MPKKPTRKRDEESAVVIASGAGGALIGGAVGSLPGAVVGFLLGVLAGALAAGEAQKSRKRRR